MKTTTCFGLMVAAGLIGALPAEQRRQIDTSWDDEFIPQPINFQFRKAGSACEYQLNYDRFAYDNRYDVQYIAEYSDGSQVQLNSISGNLARDNVWVVGLDEARAYQVAFFPDACKPGASPQSFRANFLLRSGFTYENDWTTGSLPVIEGSLPTVPQGVEMQAAPRSSTVSWSRVSDVEGYVVLVEWLVNSEVGPLPFVYARAVGAEETSYTYNREFIRASVIAVGQDNAFSALGAAYDVTP